MRREAIVSVLALGCAAAVGVAAGRASTAADPPRAPAGPPSARSTSSDAAAPKLLPMPVVRQSTEYTCGAAAVTSVLAYWRAGTDLREAQLEKLMHTTEAIGTDPVNIVKTLGDITVDGGLPPVLTTDGVQPNDGTRTVTKDGSTIVRFDAKRGPPLFDVELHYRSTALPSSAETSRDLDELRRALDRREAVLLDLQAWREDAGTDWSTDWDDGHWVVLVGLDDSNVYTMDPYSFEGYTYVPIPELVARWHGEGTNKTKWQHIAIFVAARGKAPPASTAPLLRME